jgi:hypothetical protein
VRKGEGEKTSPLIPFLVKVLDMIEVLACSAGQDEGSHACICGWCHLQEETEKRLQILRREEYPKSFCAKCGTEMFVILGMGLVCLPCQVTDDPVGEAWRVIEHDARDGKCKDGESHSLESRAYYPADGEQPQFRHVECCKCHRFWPLLWSEEEEISA